MRSARLIFVCIFCPILGSQLGASGGYYGRPYSMLQPTFDPGEAISESDAGLIVGRPIQALYEERFPAWDLKDRMAALAAAERQGDRARARAILEGIDSQPKTLGWVLEAVPIPFPDQVPQEHPEAGDNDPEVRKAAWAVTGLWQPPTGPWYWRTRYGKELEWIRRRIERIGRQPVDDDAGLRLLAVLDDPESSDEERAAAYLALGKLERWAGQDGRDGDDPPGSPDAVFNERKQLDPFLTAAEGDLDAYAGEDEPVEEVHKRREQARLSLYKDLRSIADAQPTLRLSDDAAYLLCRYALEMGDKATARRAFNDLVTRFPTGDMCARGYPNGLLPLAIDVWDAQSADEALYRLAGGEASDAMSAPLEALPAWAQGQLLLLRSERLAPGSPERAAVLAKAVAVAPVGSFPHREALFLSATIPRLLAQGIPGGEGRWEKSRNPEKKAAQRALGRSLGLRFLKLYPDDARSPFMAVHMVRHCSVPAEEEAQLLAVLEPLFLAQPFPMRFLGERYPTGSPAFVDARLRERFLVDNFRDLELLEAFPESPLALPAFLRLCSAPAPPMAAMQAFLKSLRGRVTAGQEAGARVRWASACLRSGDAGAALNEVGAARKLMKPGSDLPFEDEALWTEARSLDQLGRGPEALALYRRLVDHYPLAHPPAIGAISRPREREQRVQRWGWEPPSWPRQERMPYAEDWGPYGYGEVDGPGNGELLRTHLFYQHLHREDGHSPYVPLALMKLAADDEAHGRWDQALERYLALGYKVDLSYFVDARMPVDALAAFVAARPGHPKAGFLRYSLAVRLSRLERFDEALALLGDAAANAQLAELRESVISAKSDYGIGSGLPPEERALRFYRLGQKNFYQGIDAFNNEILGSYWLNDVTLVAQVAGTREHLPQARYYNAAQAFEKAYLQRPKGPLAANALYSWAVAGFREWLPVPHEARSLGGGPQEVLLKLVEEFPKSSLADDALLWAAYHAEDGPRQGLLKRLGSEYPDGDVLGFYDIDELMAMGEPEGRPVPRASPFKNGRFQRHNWLLRAAAPFKFGWDRYSGPEKLRPVVIGAQDSFKPGQAFDAWIYLRAPAGSDPGRGKVTLALEGLDGLWTRFDLQGSQRSLSLTAGQKVELAAEPWPPSTSRWLRVTCGRAPASPIKISARFEWRDGKGATTQGAAETTIGPGRDVWKREHGTVELPALGPAAARSARIESMMPSEGGNGLDVCFQQHDDAFRVGRLRLDGDLKVLGLDSIPVPALAGRRAELLEDGSRVFFLQDAPFERGKPFARWVSADGKRSQEYGLDRSGSRPRGYPSVRGRQLLLDDAVLAELPVRPRADAWSKGWVDPQGVGIRLRCADSGRDDVQTCRFEDGKEIGLEFDGFEVQDSRLWGDSRFLGRAPDGTAYFKLGNGSRILAFDRGGTLLADGRPSAGRASGRLRAVRILARGIELYSDETAANSRVQRVVRHRLLLP